VRSKKGLSTISQPAFRAPTDGATSSLFPFLFVTIAQERLAEIKLATNAIEQCRAVDGRRTVNLDPGYLLLERFVLASGKNYAHRIHVGRGIYADLTLVFQRGEFRALPWTYPDYADHPLRRFLSAVRQKYGLDLNAPPEPMETP